MKSIAMKLARLLVGKNEVLYGKLEFIRYGIEIILMTIIGVAGMIIISIIMDSGCGWIPFLVSFALLRNCAGGYHAKNAFSCLLISELMFCIAVFVAKIINFEKETYMLSYLICFVIVVLFAPVESEKKKLSQDLKHSNKIRSLGCMIVNLAVIVCLKNTIIKELYYLGMMFAVFSMVFAIIIKRDN